MRLLGCGSYLPQQVMQNEELAKRVETSHEWIFTRTGIVQRHIVACDQTTADLATEAALKALESANVKANDLEFIVVATTTNEEKFPSVASKVQAKLRAKHAFSFDIQAVCSGFIYALSLANHLTNHHACGLVIGAEVMSHLLDWNDRNTCVLFGDGAGAVVVNNESGGVLGTVLGTDGTLHDALYANPYIHMNGGLIFRNGIEKMQSSLQEALEKANKTLQEITYLIPHQANARMVKAISENLHFPLEKTIMTMDQHANTSAASIPLALSTVWHRLKKGDIIALTAAGAGFTWGSIIIEI